MNSAQEYGKQHKKYQNSLLYLIFSAPPKQLCRHNTLHSEMLFFCKALPFFTLTICAMRSKVSHCMFHSDSEKAPPKQNPCFGEAFYIKSNSIWITKSLFSDPDVLHASHRYHLFSAHGSQRTLLPPAGTERRTEHPHPAASTLQSLPPASEAAARLSLPDDR